jgi:DNA-dependent RNA polymerase auxiliary subunit epsilon
MNTMANILNSPTRLSTESLFLPTESQNSDSRQSLNTRVTIYARKLPNQN